LAGHSEVGHFPPQSRDALTAATALMLIFNM